MMNMESNIKQILFLPILVLWIQSIYQNVHCSVDIAIHLLSYSNLKGIKNDNQCCDTDESCFSNPCDPRIHGCISSNINSSNMNDCDVGEFITEQYIDQNNITFYDQLSPNINNPVIFRYQKHQNDTLRLIFTVEDYDGDSKHELIDNIYDFVYLNFSLNTEKLSLDRYLSGRVSNIEFTLSISCSRGYYGNNCEIYCEVSDVLDHYICSKDGDKICDNNWYGNNCNQYCKPQNDTSGYYWCSSEGEKKCLENWYGEDCTIFCHYERTSLASYTCSDNGEKVCSAHWYGVDCNVFCNPQLPDGGHYICNKTTGLKKCLPNWYGANCSTFCREVASNQYMCDINTGLKICKPYYFGYNCEKYCFANKLSNFTCNEVGDKVCHKHFQGKNCSTFVPYLPKKESFCTVSGRSFFKSFDGRFFSFTGSCSYQLAADCIDDTFALHIKSDTDCLNDNFGNCRHSVYMYLGDINIHLNSDSTVFVGNKQVDIPYRIQNILIKTFPGTNYLIITGWRGLTLRWDLHSVRIELSPLYAGKTCGLCGNFNGVPQDDFTNPDGDIEASSKAFGNSWKRLQIGEVCPSAFSYSSFSNEVETKHPLLTLKDEESIEEICSMFLSSPLSPLYPCLKIIDPKPYYEKCIEDVSICDQDTRSNCSCNTYSQYARDCAAKDIVLDWRNGTSCSIDCLNGTVFSECGTTCPKTCNNMNQEFTCDHKCIDGCFCPHGLILQNGRCIDPVECPCRHNKMLYNSGDVIMKGCNQCFCSSGKWNCTSHECPGTCSMFGDPHYHTFDGRWFDFDGKCKYVLAKDCVTNLFVIIVDNIACNPTRDVSCTKSVAIHLNGSVVLLYEGKKVLVDNSLITLPYSGPGITIRQVSSLFLKLTSAIGIEVLYDGETRIYVSVSPYFKNKTRGLCGTFNTNQYDDFLTPEGIVDTNPITFGNSWRLDPSCPLAKKKRDPCDMQAQKAKIALKKCNKLRLSPFSGCHHVVDPTPFIHACTYDLCGTSDSVNGLCNSVSAYTKKCADYGIIIEWRNNNILPECAVSCPTGQVYQECGSMCKSICQDLASHQTCNEKCIAGCNCPNVTAMNRFGSCVSFQDCPCYHNGNHYLPGSSFHREKCEKCVCMAGKFSCKIDKHRCDHLKCPGDQIWHNHTADCLKTCETLYLPCLNKVTTDGCRCPNETVWDSKIQKCVHPSKCPCHYNGRTYRHLESYKWDCNLCTCNESKWQCTANSCPGSCAIYGDPHYITFDGKRFLFEGRCGYLIAQDSCGNGRGSFSIQAENIPCGGSICTKSIIFTLNDTILYLNKDKEMTVLPATALSKMTAKYYVIKTTFFDIIHAEIGVTLTWDRGTRILVTVDPKFKGKTCGLCGNFNDNQNDDFTTPELDIVINTEEFADSWRVDSTCPDTRAPIHPCSINEERAPWSHKKCNIVNRDLFKPCHLVVDPRPYFDACYRDACGCDMGGDCECLCTSVAAYAQACNAQGVHIKWRSQEFCPIQCETCQEYKACGPSNPKTCRNMCKKELELPIKCVEGCFCPNGTVYHNGKCIESDECPCYVNGVEYQPGTLIIRDCQKCNCVNGCFQCKGETCPTTNPTLPGRTSSTDTTAASATTKNVPPTTSATATTLLIKSESTTGLTTSSTTAQTKSKKSTITHIYKTSTNPSSTAQSTIHVTTKGQSTPKSTGYLPSSSSKSATMGSSRPTTINTTSTDTTIPTSSTTARISTSTTDHRTVDKKSTHFYESSTKPTSTTHPSIHIRTEVKSQSTSVGHLPSSSTITSTNSTLKSSTKPTTNPASLATSKIPSISIATKYSTSTIDKATTPMKSSTNSSHGTSTKSTSQPSTHAATTPKSHSISTSTIAGKTTHSMEKSSAMPTANPSSTTNTATSSTVKSSTTVTPNPSSTTSNKSSTVKSSTLSTANPLSTTSNTSSTMNSSVIPTTNPSSITSTATSSTMKSSTGPTANPSSTTSTATSSTVKGSTGPTAKPSSTTSTATSSTVKSSTGPTANPSSTTSAATSSTVKGSTGATANPSSTTSTTTSLTAKSSTGPTANPSSTTSTTTSSTVKGSTGPTANPSSTTSTATSSTAKSSTGPTANPSSTTSTATSSTAKSFTISTANPISTNESTLTTLGTRATSMSSKISTSAPKTRVTTIGKATGQRSTNVRRSTPGSYSSTRTGYTDPINTTEQSTTTPLVTSNTSTHSADTHHPLSNVSTAISTNQPTTVKLITHPGKAHSSSSSVHSSTKHFTNPLQNTTHSHTDSTYSSASSPKTTHTKRISITTAPAKFTSTSKIPSSRTTPKISTTGMLKTDTTTIGSTNKTIPTTASTSPISKGSSSASSTTKSQESTTFPVTTGKKTTLSKTCIIDDKIGFQCRNHKKFCILRKYLCDNVYHCPEHDDEDGCPTQYPSTTISTSGETGIHSISTSYPINGTLPTGPTRTHPYTLHPVTGTRRPIPCDGYLCKNSRFCIMSRFVCDGDLDCPLGDDEDNCGVSTHVPYTTASTIHKSKSTSHISTTVSATNKTECKLSPWNFKCADGSKCLASSQVCNGKKDCVDGSDEISCPPNCPKCSKGNFKCHKTCECISVNFVCDNSYDCGDRSDEIGCHAQGTTPVSTTSTLSSPTAHPSCPNNKIFRKCVRNCDTKCSYLLRKCTENTRTCEPGCTCPERLVSNGTFCVLPTECSCYDNVLKVYKEANARWERNCQICSCFNDSIMCQPKLCPKLYCPPPRILTRKHGKCCDECISGTLPPFSTASTTKFSCLLSEFKCNNNECIPKAFVCDGERDCYDAEDERGCKSKQKSCFQSLGVANSKVIIEEAFQASSYRAYVYRPANARLNSVERLGFSAGSWCAANSKPAPHWIQVDLGKEFIVSKVAIQGRYMVVQFVKYFRLKYSLNGYSWNNYMYHGNVKIFTGNRVVGATKINKLEHPIQARYVRIVVESYLYQPCMRFELYGCPNYTTPIPTTATTIRTPCPEFSCANGDCILNSWVCDGKEDCSDSSDEVDCNRTCSSGEFRCHSGHCLPRKFYCDGDRDCSDGSDEWNCPTSKTCLSTQYRCPNGKCILRKHVCDGDHDCPSGADEMNCTHTPTRATTTLSTTQSTSLCTGFKCLITNVCIPQEFICDSYKDCSQGEDENCCDPDLFLCPSSPGTPLGSCIARRTLCDGFEDCAGGYDEMNCTFTTTTQKPSTTISRTTRIVTNISSEIVSGPTVVTERQMFSTTAQKKSTMCPRNSTCICENTCDSLANNMSGCMILHCVDDCTCPENYEYNNATGYCHKKIHCPCVKNGRIYRTGDVYVDKTACSRCLCKTDGFECVKYCPLSCPEDQETFYPPGGKCCECRPKLVCRADQIISDCSCPVTCDMQSNYTCEPCTKGCQCPPGKVDNGTACVDVSQCQCTSADGSIHKPNTQWPLPPCRVCKCSNGKISCGLVCNYPNCPDGFELMMPKNECCSCQPIQSTTMTTHFTSKQSTYVSPTKNITSATTTPKPERKCKKKDSMQYYEDKDKCKTMGPIIKSFCHGDCQSTVVADFLQGVAIRNCSCCKPSGLYNTTVTLSCPNGTSKQVVYTLFKECYCRPCDLSPFYDVPLWH